MSRTHRRSLHRLSTNPFLASVAVLVAGALVGALAGAREQRLGFPRSKKLLSGLLQLFR